MKHDNELYVYRRHVRTCQFFGQRNVAQNQCRCPFHVDGRFDGQRIRQSAGTRSIQDADRHLGKLVQELESSTSKRESEKSSRAGGPAGMPAERTTADAVARFLKSHGEVGADGKYRGQLAYSSWRKYRCGLTLFSAFCEGRNVIALAAVDLDLLEDYRREREVGLVTWKVELQTLRTFFGYCIRHKWLVTNPAAEMRAPRNIKPNEVVPYTLHEESLILAACDRIGGGKYQRSGAAYEQLRARAMVMLLRHTALRVSDVCTLRKDAISWDKDACRWRVFLRTQKTGEAVFLPIPEYLKLSLDALPLPRGATRDCVYYFWNGITSRRAVVGIAERTLAPVFKKSEVKNAHAHRFRHTLATRLLEQGATYEQVADILGTARKSSESTTASGRPDGRQTSTGS